MSRFLEKHFLGLQRPKLAAPQCLHPSTFMARHTRHRTDTCLSWPVCPGPHCWVIFQSVFFFLYTHSFQFCVSSEKDLIGPYFDITIIKFNKIYHCICKPVYTTNDNSSIFGVILSKNTYILLPVLFFQKLYRGPYFVNIVEKLCLFF
jgi:hypothetical protein